MIRLNLLPHREQKRQARKRQFVALSIYTGILAAAIVGLGYVILSGRVENQDSRNRLLKTEIAKLDTQIKEIDKLREQTQALLARKQVVETLQTNRTDDVHLLDQIVRQLPDGIYLRAVKQADTRVTLTGYAQSNARVSTLMRNIESSPWLQKPELVEIRSVALPNSAGQRVNEFTLNLQIKRVAPIPPAPAPGSPASAAPGAVGAPAVPAGAPAPGAPAVPVPPPAPPAKAASVPAAAEAST
jgi:type IV pilus assembly protein PilN